MTKETVTVSQALKSGCPPEEEVVGGTIRWYEIQSQRISGRRKGEWLGDEARRTPVPHLILPSGPVCGICREYGGKMNTLEIHLRRPQRKARFTIARGEGNVRRDRKEESLTMMIHEFQKA